MIKNGKATTKVDIQIQKIKISNTSSKITKQEVGVEAVKDTLVIIRANLIMKDKLIIEKDKLVRTEMNCQSVLEYVLITCPQKLISTC